MLQLAFADLQKTSSRFCFETPLNVLQVTVANLRKVSSPISFETPFDLITARL